MVKKLKFTKKLKIEIINLVFYQIKTNIKNRYYGDCICWMIRKELTKKGSEYLVSREIQEKFGLNKYKPKGASAYWFDFDEKGMIKRKNIVNKVLKELKTK